RAADRATTLTRQLLAFSRRQIVQPRVIDMSLLISEMQPMLEPLLGSKIDLRILSSPTPAHVRVDVVNVEQVIVNLAVNARDAMESGGSITIQVRTEEGGPARAGQPFVVTDGPCVVVDVTDTGTGMSEQVKSHLFEPFFTTKEKGQGTGLGLSTSYGIIKQNLGEIIVKSELGRGSTFSIYLPRVDEPCEVLPAPVALGSYSGAETILLAEDEEDVRKVVTEMLRKQGYTVLAAVGGAHALEIAGRAGRPVDLLVTDMVMPGMGGRELAQKLRAGFPRTRVLFVSGYTDAAIVTDDEPESVTAFLHKPFAPEDLARKVREVLETPAPEPLSKPV
ncbi:MAG: response regulator, partial [Bryobacteraceae bacterium]|nr:response regulator [Bryobacteraceae bacterium]